MHLSENLLKLQYLYSLEMLGEEFCDNFPTSQDREQKGVLGHSPQKAKIGFISQTPLLNENTHFLPQKSAQMLEDIITKVFNLSLQEACILSLFKTQAISYDENLKQHIQILLSQISQSSAKIFVIFGNTEIAQYLFNKNTNIGSAINFKNKTMIVTHSFKALIKLAALKKQTLQHLKTAKTLL